MGWLFERTQPTPGSNRTLSFLQSPRRRGLGFFPEIPPGAQFDAVAVSPFPPPYESPVSYLSCATESSGRWTRCCCSSPLNRPKTRFPTLFSGHVRNSLRRRRRKRGMAKKYASRHPLFPSFNKRIFSPPRTRLKPATPTNHDICDFFIPPLSLVDPSLFRRKLIRQRISPCQCKIRFVAKNSLFHVHPRITWYVEGPTRLAT